MVTSRPASLSPPPTHTQVSVQCVERGELLAQVRNRYSDLLSRVPLEMKRYTHVHAHTAPAGEESCT